MGKKKILWMVVFLLIAILTIFAIVTQSSSFSFAEFCNDIKYAKKGWFALGVFCMLGSIYMEGSAITCILKKMLPKKNRPKLHGLLYSAGDIYFSSITPSASGGQPVSAYFMIRDGISPSLTTVTLILNLMMYTASLLLVGILCSLIRPAIFLQMSVLARVLISLGFIILVGLVIGFAMCLWKENLVRRIANGLLKFLTKIHLFKGEEKLSRKLDKTMDEFAQLADIAYGKKGIFLQPFLRNFCQRLFQTGGTVFMFLATGGSVKYAIDVWAVQGYTYLGANCLPIPGAVGAADYLLLEGFSHIEGIDSPANLELLSRGVSFYLGVVLCGFISLGGYLWVRKRVVTSEVDVAESHVNGAD